MDIPLKHVEELNTATGYAGGNFCYQEQTCALRFSGVFPLGVFYYPVSLALFSDLHHWEGLQKWQACRSQVAHGIKSKQTVFYCFTLPKGHTVRRRNLVNKHKATSFCVYELVSPTCMKMHVCTFCIQLMTFWDKICFDRWVLK